VKILLADDSVTAQNMAKKILAEAGHEVLAVSNGAAALKKAAEQRPDLAILDVYMPGYTGLEVAQRFRESQDLASIPIILTVGKLEPFKKADAKNVQAEVVIIKPFEATELTAAASKVAERLPVSKAAAPPKPQRKRDWKEEPEPEVESGKTTSELLAEQESPPTDEAELKAEESVPLEPGKTPIEDREEDSARLRAATAEFEEAQAESQTFATGVDAPSPSQGDEGPTIAASADTSPVTEFFPKKGETENEREAVPEIAKDAAEPIESAASSQEHSGVVLGTLQNFEPTIAVSTGAAAAVPALDPAFSADRTQWATDFPTHFGIKERGDNRKVSEPAPASVEPAAEGSEIMAAGTVTSTTGAADVPTVGRAFSASLCGEELPVEAHESCLSLAEEMERVLTTGVTAPQFEHGLSIEDLTEPEPAKTALASAMPSASVEDEPAILEELVQPPARENIGLEASETIDSAPTAAVPPVEEPVSNEFFCDSTSAQGTAEDAAAQLGQDGESAPEMAQDTHVQEDRVVEAAVRKAESALMAELAGPSAELAAAAGTSDSASVGTAAIESIVNRVLEQLKPKLVAEIAKELAEKKE
jgi:CheY-like chemotaxis protein